MKPLFSRAPKRPWSQSWAVSALLTGALACTLASAQTPPPAAPPAAPPTAETPRVDDSASTASGHGSTALPRGPQGRAVGRGRGNDPRDRKPRGHNARAGRRGSRVQSQPRLPLLRRPPGPDRRAGFTTPRRVVHPDCRVACWNVGTRVAALGHRRSAQPGCRTRSPPVAPVRATRRPARPTSTTAHRDSPRGEVRGGRNGSTTSSGGGTDPGGRNSRLPGSGPQRRTPFGGIERGRSPPRRVPLLSRPTGSPIPRAGQLPQIVVLLYNK